MNKGILAIVTFITALVAWVIVLSEPYFFTKEKQNRIPIKFITIFLLGSLFFTPVVFSFCTIAYDMWDSDGVSAGSVRYSKAMSLAGAHMWFLIMFLILIIALWIRAFKRIHFSPWISAIGSFIFLIFISISFYYTVPRSGDDEVIMWVLLMPGFFFADLILIITIILFSIICLVRQIKAGRKGGTTDETPATSMEIKLL